MFGALIVLAGCTPRAGDLCDKPGDVYAHGDTRLSCGKDGKWHK